MTPNWPFPQPGQPMRDDPLPPIRQPQQRAKGCHAYAEFVAAELHYAAPQPVEPRDELADLLRQYLQRREEDQAMDARLQRQLAAHLALKAAA